MKKKKRGLGISKSEMRQPKQTLNSIGETDESVDLSAALKYRTGKSSGPAGEITSLIGN